MIKIGIIGAENTHTIAIAKAINIDKEVEDCKVVVVWGETKELAEKAAAEGQIPKIVEDPTDMLDEVDAVVIDHRDGKYHLPTAIPFVKKGIPIFIDKPLCCSLSEGKEFFKLVQQYRTPVTSFSVLPLQQSFLKFKESLPSLGKLSAIVSAGPCDLKSPWGGIFFYGVHQVDVLIHLLGYEVTYAQVNLNGDYSTGTLYYKDGIIATLNLLKDRVAGFYIMAIGEKDTLARKLEFDNKMFLPGIKIFTEMFRTKKEPTYFTDYTKILAAVAILEALQKSIERNGEKIQIEDFKI